MFKLRGCSKCHGDLYAGEDVRKTSTAHTWPAYSAGAISS